MPRRVVHKWFGDQVSSAVAKAGERALADEAAGLRDVVVRDYLSGQSLGVITGALRTSITWARSGLGRYRVGTNLPYAAIHEFGGTIKARGKKLAIPIGHALTAGGAPRYESPNDVPGELQLVTRDGKAPLLVQQPKKGKGVTKLFFVLLSSVRIPARPYLRPAFIREAPEIHKRMGNVIGRAASEAGG